MRLVGRGLQLVGLGVPPLAIILELSESVSLGQMLLMLVAALCLFWIGRLVEGYSR
jgi:hypothetical protein